MIDHCSNWRRVVFKLLTRSTVSRPLVLSIFFTANGSGTPAVLFAGDFGQIRGIAAGANIFFGAAPLLVAVPELQLRTALVQLVLVLLQVLARQGVAMYVSALARTLVRVGWRSESLR